MSEKNNFENLSLQIDGIEQHQNELDKGSDIEFKEQQLSGSAASSPSQEYVHVPTIETNADGEPLRCPHCGGRIFHSGNRWVCENYGADEGKCKFLVWETVAKHTLTHAELEELCTKKIVGPLHLKNKEGVEFDASLVVNEKGEVVFSYSNRGDLMPFRSQYGAIYLKDGKYGQYYCCEGLPHVYLNPEWCHHKWTPDEIVKLFDGNETDMIGFVSTSKGKPFTARCCLEDGKVSPIFE